MKRFIPLCLALVCVGFMASALLAAPAPNTPHITPQMNSTNYALDWSAVEEVSGGASTSANYKLDATIGQMAANTSNTSANYGLCTGFECVLNLLRVYLPVIFR